MSTDDKWADLSLTGTFDPHTSTNQDNFNLDISTLENDDVLENFDFDAFLNTDNHDTFRFDRPSAEETDVTISEDLAEGKLAQKDKDLKLLIKAPTIVVPAKVSLFQAIPVSHGPQFDSSSHLDRAGWDTSSRLTTVDKSVTPSLSYTIVRGSMESNHKASAPKGKKRKASMLAGASRRDAASSPLLTEEEYATHTQNVYVIQCHDLHARHHAALAYEDEPSLGVDNYPSQLAAGELRHLNGRRPIPNLANFMKTDDDKIAIVIVRVVKCNENFHVGLQSKSELIFTEHLALKSSRLRAAVAAVAKCYFHRLSDGTFDKKDQHSSQIDQFSINPAKSFFFHHVPLLEEYVLHHPDTAQHVRVLLMFCKLRYGQEFAAATELFRRGKVSQQHLDKLYLPNTPVVCRHSNLSSSIWMIYSWPQFFSNGEMELDCWRWQHDGKKLVRRSFKTRMDPLKHATTSIVDLGIYPLSHASVEMQDELTRQGQKYWAHRNMSYVSYKGWNVSKDEYYPGSRFIIDYGVYKKMHEYGFAFSFTTAPPPRTYDTWPESLDLDHTPTSTDYMLMPADIHGYYLVEKQWVNIYVDGVEKIQWNKSAYERLVLPKQTKDLIRALVTVRASQRGVKHGIGSVGKRVDIIPGKGNGLIMLLHGGPGTGKSLTAESVAEIAEMPLYRVTCGDIGTTPTEVEKYLASVMYLGTTWNCVLLLDEADVFLEERSMSDLARNSLVSVFLRVLEYYDGILILTSNRVGIFDEAFKSRIQVALHYQNLTRTARKKIWTNFIEMLEEDEEDVDFDELRSRLDELASVDMNGRQIRNTMTTARELAMYKSETLEWKHLDEALKVSTDFGEYIRKMQGHTDDQKARDEKLR